MRPPFKTGQHLGPLSVISFILVLLLLPTLSAQPAVGQRAATGAFPASQAFSHWLEQQRGANVVSAQALAEGVELARARQTEMRSLLRNDPAEFVRRSMPANDRAPLAPELRTLIEEHIKGRGSFAMYCVFPPARAEVPTGAPHRPGYVREVRLGGAVYEALVYGQWRNQQTVQDAELAGVTLGDLIALGDAPTPMEQAAAGQAVTASSPSTTGPNTLLYMIAQFSDQTTDPIDEPTVLSQMAVVSNFWMNCSGGLVFIQGLVHSTQVVDIVHIKLPSTASTYVNNFATLIGDARSAASSQGFNYANYNLDVVVTSNSGFSYAGMSYIGAQGSHWVTPYTTLRTAGHELGHNLGLYHANYWRTDSTQPFGADSNPGGYVADYSNAEWVEYGHYFSVMSAQYGSEWDDATKPIYSPVEKVRLGWLSGSQVQYVTSNGTYRLFRHDARTTVGTPRGIRIETPATDYTGYGRRYWLQYRYDPWNTAQNWYQRGVEVDVAETSYGADGSILLDMTPYSKDQSTPFFDANNKPGNWWTIDNSDKVDGALMVGRSYDDTAAGVHITPIDTGSSGTGEEFIDVVITLGGFSGNHPPVITAFTASTNQAAVGQMVNFNVVASDPDGDPLAYSWDFDQVQVWTSSGLNSASAANSWPSAGQYRVMVRVSDMKGGVTTASQIITVGAPAGAGEIWGRVVWGGRPVSGARVSTTSGVQAWTDSDGTYVLTDLTLGTNYTVNCLAGGLTFAPQFTNPVSLSSGNAYGMDFYANQLLPGAGGSGYAVSGQVTDPVNGAVGIEVRGGGMITTTDGSGNYQLTNFVNGTYNITARNPGWTFAPASQSVTINSANSTGNNFARVASCSVSGNITGLPTTGNSQAPSVYLSDGRSVTTTKAGQQGNRYWAYTLNNVPAGQYSVTAFLYGYSIQPSGFSNPLAVSGALANVNFTATASNNIAGAITGRVTQYGVPLSGASVSALVGSSTVGSGFTDSDGYYRIDGLPSSAYTVTPVKSGYSFSPASLSVASVPSGGNNFAASGSVAPPAINSVSANPPVVSAGNGSTTLSAVAGGAGPLSYSWDAVLAPAPVTFSVNDSSAAASTVASVQAPGNYTFRVRVVDTNGFAVTGTVGVTVSAGPGSMLVSPYEVQISGGQTVAFTADGWDQVGNRISLSPMWNASGGGSIDSNGVYSATIAGGPFMVTATAAGLSATGLVWVTSSLTAVSRPLIQSIIVSNGSVVVTWTTVPSATYRIQYKSDPEDSVWTSLGSDIVAGGPTASANDALGVGRRFYRIMLVQ